ncbi:hypothetical Protein YC6258_04115 [Gynuella sunshinyii YC6258]|uniref:Uncharacterized protein n=1 Tax=Gynuella sunshinyii YC6258 TaxID=1445510 RepID=A0A0C5VPG3_9GAMM|nr:hypothetical Protein YC6258_04115 [Gynuella sunshinyii YC6258]
MANFAGSWGHFYVLSFSLRFSCYEPEHSFSIWFIQNQLLLMMKMSVICEQGNRI